MHINLSTRGIQKCIIRCYFSLFSHFPQKAAMCVWPMISTANFALVPEKNRVVFISMCSLIWTCFLAYVKQLDQKNVDKMYTSE